MDIIEATLMTKRQQYRAAFKATHNEAYLASKRRVSTRARTARDALEALDPALREARLEVRKAYRDAHKEASAAYKARKRAERRAVSALGGVGVA